MTDDLPGLVQRLRDAHAASTQGEWEVRGPSVDADPADPQLDDYILMGPTQVMDGEEWVQIPASCNHIDNADFIALAHNAMPAILDRLSAAEARVKELEGALPRTADGVVVLPGMMVYYDDSKYYSHIDNGIATWMCVGVGLPNCDSRFYKKPCYSTPAAAAAARAEKEGERQ